MAWEQRVNLKGPAGTKGEEVTLRTNGANIEWRLGTGVWQVLIALSALQGPAGSDGTSVTIAGSVASVGSLPTTLTSADNGDGYITQNDGHLHVWDGDSFNDVGNVRGPAGADGPAGTAGTNGTNGREVSLQVSGGYLQWRLGTDTWTNLIAIETLRGPQGDAGLRGSQIFDGAGVPGTVVGSAPGDYYLDTITGTLYKLA